MCGKAPKIPATPTRSVDDDIRIQQQQQQAAEQKAIRDAQRQAEADARAREAEMARMVRQQELAQQAAEQEAIRQQRLAEVQAQQQAAEQEKMARLQAELSANGLTQQTAAQMDLARQQNALAEEQRQKLLAEQRQQKAEDLDKFNRNVDAAYNSALGSARSNVEQRGLNWDDYASGITTELGRLRTTIPELDSRPGNYFSDNVADIVLNRAQDTQRRNYVNAVDQFAGNGFADKAWGNTSDDQYIDAILGEQYQPATETLLRAHQRGTLNDQGYEAAIKSLDSQRTAARSRLQSQGEGILSGYRSALTDIGNEARTNASNYNLGSTFDPSSYQSRIDSLRTDQSGKLEGDIRGLVGSDPLFDISSILQSSGASQGVTSGTSPLLDSFYQSEQKKRTQEDKGLGQQGVF